MPPPAKKANCCGQWSRPAAEVSAPVVRPNSPAITTSVSCNRPAASRSVSSEEMALSKAALLDNAISSLLTDLDAAGLLQDTLVVMAGEFGRTTGALTSAAGRDHWPQQFAFFAGGGIKSGQILGQTNTVGSDVVDF